MRMLILASIMLFACDKQNTVVKEKFWLYSYTNDYSENVPVQLSADRKHIAGFPSPSDINFDMPYKLIKGYYCGGTFGINTGFLKIKKNEYAKLSSTPNIDTLYRWLIDKDPFIEFYESKNNDLIFNEIGIDTSFLNKLILENEIENYFYRLK